MFNKERYQIVTSIENGFKSKIKKILGLPESYNFIEKFAVIPSASQLSELRQLSHETDYVRSLYADHNSYNYCEHLLKKQFSISI